MTLPGSQPTEYTTFKAMLDALGEKGGTDVIRARQHGSKLLYRTKSGGGWKLSLRRLIPNLRVTIIGSHGKRTVSLEERAALKDSWGRNGAMMLLHNDFEAEEVAEIVREFKQKYNKDISASEMTSGDLYALGELRAEHLCQPPPESSAPSRTKKARAPKLAKAQPYTATPYGQQQRRWQKEILTNKSPASDRAALLRDLEKEKGRCKHVTDLYHEICQDVNELDDLPNGDVDCVSEVAHDVKEALEVLGQWGVSWRAFEAQKALLCHLEEIDAKTENLPDHMYQQGATRQEIDLTMRRLAEIKYKLAIGIRQLQYTAEYEYERKEPTILPAMEMRPREQGYLKARDQLLDKWDTFWKTREAASKSDAWQNSNVRDFFYEAVKSVDDHFCELVRIELAEPDVDYYNIEVENWVEAFSGGINALEQMASDMDIHADRHVKDSIAALRACEVPAKKMASYEKKHKRRLLR